MFQVKPYPKNENYLVRTDGVIVSVKTGNPLKSQTVTGGYQYVKLGRKGQYKGVHRLVAETWIPNPTNLLEVNHKDANKLNNCVENLEWMTRSQNAIHAVQKGLMNQKLNVEQIQVIRQRLDSGVMQVTLSKEYGVTKSMIHYIAKGKSWGHS
jgi:hypothetical protein